ncbi:MAG: dihydropteroate synthase [Bacteroidales bacterium]|nr:dihydropteroate synthase [Bacteroidales bacterium]
MTENISFTPFSLRCGDRLLSYDRPAVMGILNVTPDSFYDGGRYLGEEQMLARAQQLADEGADIIDLGVVSTRPGAQLLTPDEEAQRLAPAVAAVRRQLPDAILSVDTCFALPARAAVEAGADIINDISGGAFDPDMFATVAHLGTPYVLMHNLGTPDHMQDNPHYDNLLQEVVLQLSQRLEALHGLGVHDVIIDPGFGFAKTLEHNYQLLAQLPALRRLFPNQPLLVALSRKSMVYKALDTTPDDALIGTTALHAAALLGGAQLLRVHDVRAARQVITLIARLQQAAATVS